MNPTFRITRGLSLRLLVMHMVLITLVTVAMLISLPTNDLIG